VSFENGKSLDGKVKYLVCV